MMKTLIRRRISSIIPYVLLMTMSGVTIFQLYGQMKGTALGYTLLVIFFVTCVIVVRSIVVAHITIDNQKVYVRKAFTTDKFAISDLEEMSISTEAYKASKFILKNSRVIYFESYSLRESDISFLQSLKELK